MVFLRVFVVLWGIAFAMTAAHAMTLEDSTAKTGKAADIAAGTTTGTGRDFSIQLGDGRIGLQIGSVTLDLAGDYLNGGVDYHNSGDRQSAATIDFYPWGGGFRLSLGARVNTNAMRLSGHPASVMQLGSAGYDPGGIAAMGGGSSIGTISPYLGIGYSRPMIGNLPVSFDLGLLYQGDTQNGLGGLAGLQSELAADNQRLHNYLFSSQLDPVAMISIDYRF